MTGQSSKKLLHDAMKSILCLLRLNSQQVLLKISLKSGLEINMVSHVKSFWLLTLSFFTVSLL